ncbi:MAG: response regulator transcription factor [Verrucomicrobia bacterium]|nr:response regulator transcription factor [Verrucomicrobiota bacterium]
MSNLKPKFEAGYFAGKRKVLIVDDHAILRQGIKQLIDQEPDLAVCWDGEDPTKVLEAIGAQQPDIAIVDLSLKNSDGLELIKHVHAKFPEVRILVLSMFDESLYAARVMHAGAHGYVMKEEATNNVLLAIRTVLRSEIYLSAKTKDKLLQNLFVGLPGSGKPSVNRLTDRELEVFRLLGQGLGTRQVADAMRLSVKTVETYRAGIMKKLEFKSATELVQRAFDWVHHESSGRRNL